MKTISKKFLFERYNQLKIEYNTDKKFAGQSQNQKEI